MITLEQMEAHIQDLIEVRLPGMFLGRTLKGSTVQKFADAMRSNVLEKEGRIFAPAMYTLFVRPEEVGPWQDGRLLEAVKESLYTAGRDAGMEFVTPPVLLVSVDSDVPSGEVRVVASHKPESLGATENVARNGQEEAEEMHLPNNAFLIIDGRKVFPLKAPVINIGRRLENQLVIDDPRVSRTHSQLRAIKGRYVIFDLNSTGGTFVNGQRTNQTVLYPGDVISLAGVTLVFGQDNPPPRPDLKETGPLGPQQNSDRPTAVLKGQSDSTSNNK